MPYGGGYICANCGCWVPTGFFHNCPTVPTKTEPATYWTNTYIYPTERIAAALERIADALEKIKE